MKIQFDVPIDNEFIPEIWRVIRMKIVKMVNDDSVIKEIITNVLKHYSWDPMLETQFNDIIDKRIKKLLSNLARE